MQVQDKDTRKMALSKVSFLVIAFFKLPFFLNIFYELSGTEDKDIYLDVEI